MTDLEFEDEQHLQNYVVKVLRDQGWNVKTEAAPRMCKDWNEPYRADIICSRELLDSGKFYKIGLELKHLHRNTKGGKIAEAVRQVVDQYQGREYLCPTKGNYEAYNMWAFLPYFELDEPDDKFIANSTFIQSFIQKFGIGYATLREDKCFVEFRTDANNVVLFNRYSKSKETLREWTRQSLEECNYSKSKDLVEKRIEGDFR